MDVDKIYGKGGQSKDQYVPRANSIDRE
jgi:hypothetical protein